MCSTDTRVNLTQPHPHLLEGVEIKRGYLNFLVTKYERKWILCVREHMMDPTLPRSGSLGRKPGTDTQGGGEI